MIPTGKHCRLRLPVSRPMRRWRQSWPTSIRLALFPGPAAAVGVTRPGRPFGPSAARRPQGSLTLAAMLPVRYARAEILKSSAAERAAVRSERQQIRRSPAGRRMVIWCRVGCGTLVMRDHVGFLITTNLFSVRRANFAKPRRPLTASSPAKNGMSRIIAGGSHHRREPRSETPAFSRSPSQYAQ
jgi:hypothetical protein